ncbi:MAG: hypothetical protein ACK5X3_21035 [Pseudomonadota bacterium]|jgi:hypothetical protein|nr:hypothetical protein [Acetobacteraceae bacterium]
MSETFPASGAAAVTASDTTELGPCRALYVGGAGNVVVQMPNRDTSITFSSVPAGTILPVMARRVMAATTATSIVALY